MQLHELRAKTPRRKRKTIGRGGKRGTTSGRGTKGQKARAGHRIRPAIRDVLKRLPKRRGHRAPSLAEARPRAEVSLRALEKNFTAGTIVTPSALIAAKVVKLVGGTMPAIKILATGTLSKKLVINGCGVSAGARAAIEAQGGQIS